MTQGSPGNDTPQVPRIVPQLWWVRRHSAILAPKGSLCIHKSVRAGCVRSLQSAIVDRLDLVAVPRRILCKERASCGVCHEASWRIDRRLAAGQTTTSGMVQYMATCAHADAVKSERFLAIETAQTGLYRLATI